MIAPRSDKSGGRIVSQPFKKGKVLTEGILLHSGNRLV
jgi:hypothetical protein